MPNFLKKTLKKRTGKTLLASFVFILVAILNVGANGVSLQSVIAATVNQYSFNTNSKDFSTLRSSNYTDFPNSTNNWALTTQADAGDVVSLAVYYHNEAGVPAQNTKISINVPGNAGTSIQGDARLWADNFNESQGQTTVNISSSQTLTYIPGSARWYPDQSTTPTPFPFGQTGDEVITSGGVNIGDIDSGWEFQGSVVARFQISNDNNPQPTGSSTIDVTANGSQGPYTLADNEEFTVDWITSNATNCEFFLDGSLLSGVAENGSMGPIGSGHPYYPAVDSQKTFTITCEGLSGDVTDSVVLLRGSVTPPDQPQDPGTSSIDVTANGSQGPLTVSGEAFTVDWISANTTNCEFSLNNEFLSGVQENGSMGPIDANHPYYPAEGASNTFTITCEGLSGDVTDSVVVRRDLPPPPPAPLSPPVISVQTGGACGGTIDLSWNPVTNATFYKIIRGGQTIATTTALSYTDTGLVPDQSYSYTVRALNDSQESADSSLVATMASAACVEETSDIDVTANGSQGPYTLADNEEFTVDWITSNATNCEFFLDGSLLSGVAENGSMGPIGSGHPYYPAEGGSKTFTVTCDGLQGQISDSVVVNRPSAPQPEVPDAPTLASIQSSCEGTVTLTWNSVSNATLYKVFRGGTQIATTTSTSYVDNNVVANTLYSYTVKASNSVGDSVNSNVLSTTVPGSCEVPPQAPTIFAVTGTSCGGNIFVSWNAVENATSYDVYRNGTLVSTTGDVSFTDTGLNFGQSYTYQVKAKNQAGTSAFSNAASANASEKCPLPDLEVSLNANPSTINKGENSTLTWSSLNTISCSAPWTTSTSTSGNQVVSPQSDTSYSITCTDGSRTKSATTTIIVKTGGGGGDKDVTVDLTANPDTITKGQNSTLTWNSTNATSCSATWTTSTSTSGSTVVSPATTTAYSITCQNATKSASDTATVTVIDEPVCVLPDITSALAASGKVNQAFSYTFTATSTGNFSLSVATSSLPNGLSFAGNIISGIPTEEGTFSVAISATNSCGTTEKVLVITIAPAGGGGGGGNNVTVDLTANPTSVFANATSTLSWTSTNATSCSAAWTTSTSTSGTQAVTVTATTTYSITCQNSSDSASDTVTITVLPNLQCTIPSLTSSLNVSGKVGDPFSYTFTANSSATSTLSFVLGTSTLPQGLTYSNGVISGTPTTEGTFNVPFTISDDCGTVFDLILVITIAPAGGGGGGGTSVTVDLNANPPGIFAGTTSTLSWTSTNATSCSAAWTTSTSTSGSLVVSPDQTTTYDITCTNGSQNATDSATVTILTSGGGGGGRSGGGSSGGTIVTPPLVLGDIAECEYLKDYLRIDWDNDPVEVIKLQVFLKELEGFTDLQITRVFDQQTFDAVAEFQVRYQPDILTPWGYRQGEYTGFVYILTKKKVNEIFCQKAFPLNSAQQSEIIAFRAFLESLRSQGISIPGVTEPETPGVTPPASSTIDLGPILGTPIDLEVDGGEGLLSNENLRNVAAAVFAGPDGLNETLEAIAIFILALLAIYFISRAILGRAEKEGVMSPVEKRRTRLFHFLVGLALVTLIALIFSYYDIVLPLLVLIIILGAVLLWLIFAKEKNKAIMIPPNENSEGAIQPEEKKGFAGLIDEDDDLPPFTEPIDEVPDETEVINEDLEN